MVPFRSNFLNILSLLPSQQPQAFDRAEEAYDINGLLSVPALLDEITSPIPRRRSSKETLKRGSRRSSFAAAARRRGTVTTFLRALGTEDQNEAHEEVTEAYSALKRVKNRAAPLSERVEMIRYSYLLRSCSLLTTRYSEEQQIIRDAKERLSCFQLWYLQTTHVSYCPVQPSCHVRLWGSHKLGSRGSLWL